MSLPALKPFLTLSEILGPGHIHVPRPHDRASHWFPGGIPNLDSFSGISLPISGTMPVICSAGFTTPSALDLLALAGIALAGDRIEYRAGEHEAAIAKAGPELRLVFSHAYPPDDPATARSWIDPGLLTFLNNKANLTQLVPEGACPRRRVTNWADFVASPSPAPAVLKAVTEQSTGAGTAILIYRDAEDLPAAQTKFDGVETVVVEELLDIVANPCLNFAIDSSAHVQFLGAAEQIVGPAGNFIGNWIDLSQPVAEEVLAPARAVIERSAAMGYRGIAGIDMARTRDGRTVVLDLNFRINSCTPALLFAPDLRNRGVRLMRLATIRHPPGAANLAEVIAPFVASGAVVPLRLFDPLAAGLDGGDAIAHLLVTGASRQDVTENWEELGRAIALPEP